MEYPVIVEQSEGVWRAVLPTLADLSAEGSSFDEALSNARRAAEDYLSKVVLTTIEVNGSSSPPHSRSPQNWIEAGGMFVGDEEAMLQHIEEIYAERRRQREEVQRELEIVNELTATNPDLRPGSPKAVLRAAADCRIDSNSELYQQYLADLEAEKQRQREVAEKETDAAEGQGLAA